MSRQARLDDLNAELEALKLFNKQRIIVGSAYKKAKKKLVGKIADLEAEIESARREAVRRAEEARKKALKAEARFKKRNKPVVEISFSVPALIRAYKQLKAAGVQDVRVVTGGIDMKALVTGDSRAFIKQFIEYEYGGYRYLVDNGEKTQFFAPSRISATKLRQMFRDGVSHCVFTPILKKLQERLSDAGGSKKRVMQRIKMMEAFRDEYEDGVPEEEMERVAKASGLKIVVKDLLGKKDLLVLNQNGREGVLKLTNSRENHVEDGLLVVDSDPKDVSIKALTALYKKCVSEKQPFTVWGDLASGDIQRLHTLDGAFRLADPNREYFEKMNEICSLSKIQLNASKHPDVNAFIKRGRIINAWATTICDGLVADKHYDMPKAYTQFKRCEWYAGFLGKIHQWRCGSFDRTWIEEHIGIYRFKVVSGAGWFQKLGLGEGTHILPSVEILYFMDKGVEVEIDAGVWGSRMDFEFPEEMLEEKRYALWAGRLGMDREYEVHSFHASKEWAAHLMTVYGNNCHYWEDQGICCVKVPVENRHTAHHVFAFITSYVRIQMMEAIEKIGVERVSKVIMDGIYFQGEAPEELGWFKEKPLIEHKISMDWYSQEDVNVEWGQVWIKGNTLISGMGGCGKTTTVMKDKCFNDVLFVVPCHALGKKVCEDHPGSRYVTIHKLIGIECSPYDKVPGVLVVDEVTQYRASWIEKILKMYKDSLVILLGDLNQKMWYQTRGGTPGDFHIPWKPSGMDMIEMKDDRRSLDTEIRDLKLKVRQVMEENFVNGDEGEDIVMQMWARENLPVVGFEEAVGMWKPGDIWIAGTNLTHEKLLERGVVSGWYLRGDVSYEEKEGMVKRGSFTVHAYQGQTYDRGKIFIKISDLFEFTMLFTAISRARRIEQLVFVQ